MKIFYYLFALVFMLTLDVIWIGSNRKMYVGAVESIQQLQPMEINLLATALVYIFLYAALVLVAIPPVVGKRNENLDVPYANTKDTALSIFKRSLLHGGSLGLLIYGVYNLTTKAILHNYPWKVCVLDTVWGAVMFTLVCFCSVTITKTCQASRKQCKKIN